MQRSNNQDFRLSFVYNSEKWMFFTRVKSSVPGIMEFPWQNTLNDDVDLYLMTWKFADDTCNWVQKKKEITEQQDPICAVF